MPTKVAILDLLCEREVYGPKGNAAAMRPFGEVDILALNPQLPSLEGWQSEGDWGGLPFHRVPMPSDVEAWFDDGVAALIISGSRSNLTMHESWMDEAADFVRRAVEHGVPTLGICFGHQALAHTLGGEVKRRDVWGLGAQPINIHCVKPWMIPQLSSPIISFCHEDEVTKLPEGGKLVGGNESCEIAMFTKGDHIFSMQPHPEFSNEFTRDLYCEWSHLFDDSSLETANNSLESPSDRLIIAAWIREFFSYPRA